MSKKWFLWRVLAFLFLVILLVAGGGAIAYFAWSHGYATGQSAAAGEGVVTPPYPPYAFGHPGHFGFVRPLLCVGTFLLLFVAIGGFFRMLAWRRMWACGPGPMWHHWGPHPRPARWARHWRHHGPMPPCCQGWDEPCDEEAGETGAKPDAEE